MKLRHLFTAIGLLILTVGGFNVLSASAHGHGFQNRCGVFLSFGDSYSQGGHVKITAHGVVILDKDIPNGGGWEVSRAEPTTGYHWDIVVTSNDGVGAFHESGNEPACPPNTEVPPSTTKPPTTTAPPTTLVSSSTVPVTSVSQTTPTSPSSTSEPATSTTEVSSLPSSLPTNPQSDLPSRDPIPTGAGSYRCPPPGHPIPSDCAPTTQLPATGSDTGGLAVIGILMLLAGASVVCAIRHDRAQS